MTENNGFQEREVELLNSTFVVDERGTVFCKTVVCYATRKVALVRASERNLHAKGARTNSVDDYLSMTGGQRPSLTVSFADFFAGYEVL